MAQTVDITVYGFQKQGSEEKCRSFLKVLAKNGYVPLKYGSSERGGYAFDNENDFLSFWTGLEKGNHGIGILVVKGKGLYISVKWGGAKPYCTWINLTIKKNEDWIKLLHFAKDIFQWSGAVYGYTKLTKERNELATPGCNIIDCLGGITWANFFGKPYVDMWGEEKLLNAPTWKTERLDDGGFLLITTESPIIDPVVAAEAEAKLRAYLGEEHFYKRPTGEPERITREELYEKVFGDHEPEPTGYVAPDFEKYYDLSVEKIIKF